MSQTTSAQLSGTASCTSRTVRREPSPSQGTPSRVTITSDRYRTDEQINASSWSASKADGRALVTGMYRYAPFYRYAPRLWGNALGRMKGVRNGATLIANP